MKLISLAFLPLILTLTSLAASLPSIDNIRTSVRDRVQRVVFDITGDSDPAYYLKRDKDSVYLTLEAIISESKQRELSAKLSNTRYISSVEFMPLTDEVETVIIIKLRGNPKVKEFFSLPSPSRVVIDLEE